MAIACSVRMRGGESIPVWDSSTVLRCDYSRVTRVSSTSYDSSNVPAVFCAFLASSGSHGIATPPLLPNFTVYSRVVPLVGFWLMWRSSGLRLRWQRSLR